MLKLDLDAVLSDDAVGEVCAEVQKRSSQKLKILQTFRNFLRRNVLCGIL